MITRNYLLTIFILLAGFAAGALVGALMALTVVWIVNSVSRLFHARFMLADESLKIKHFVKAFIGKA